MKTSGPKNPNKVLLYYCIGALVALLVFNWLVFPQMMRGAVTEVTSTSSFRTSQRAAWWPWRRTPPPAPSPIR